MIAYEVVEGVWPQPMIRVDVHEPFQAAYYPSENEVRIDLPDCTPEYLLLVLGHELVHWAHFMSLKEAEAAPWLDAFALDSSIFHRSRRAMELAACWSPDWPVPDHELLNAERRRAQRIIRHRNGSLSWRRIPLVEPITEEEREICACLGALA